MEEFDSILPSPPNEHLAIFQPPGHPKPTFDFPSVHDKKPPYKRSGPPRLIFSAFMMTSQTMGHGRYAHRVKKLVSPPGSAFPTANESVCCLISFRSL